MLLHAINKFSKILLTQVGTTQIYTLSSPQITPNLWSSPYVQEPDRRKTYSSLP